MLTNREREITQLVASGHSNRELSRGLEFLRERSRFICITYLTRLYNIERRQSGLAAKPLQRETGKATSALDRLREPLLGEGQSLS